MEQPLGQTHCPPSVEQLGRELGALLCEQPLLPQGATLAHLADQASCHGRCDPPTSSQVNRRLLGSSSHQLGHPVQGDRDGRRRFSKGDDADPPIAEAVGRQGCPFFDELLRLIRRADSTGHPYRRK